MAYKYKLNEMSKTASADEAEKELGIPKRKFEVGQVTVSKDGRTKFTVTDIDDVTGRISWKVETLPGIEKLFDDVNTAYNWINVTGGNVNLGIGGQAFTMSSTEGSGESMPATAYIQPTVSTIIGLETSSAGTNLASDSTWALVEELGPY